MLRCLFLVLLLLLAITSVGGLLIGQMIVEVRLAGVLLMLLAVGAAGGLQDQSAAFLEIDSLSDAGRAYALAAAASPASVASTPRRVAVRRRPSAVMSSATTSRSSAPLSNPTPTTSATLLPSTWPCAYMGSVRP